MKATRIYAPSVWAHDYKVHNYYIDVRKDYEKVVGGPSL